jgi:hypothetical protein
MAFEENVRTWLGAFHESPSGVYWEGYARLQTSLNYIQEIAKELRASAAAKVATSGSATNSPVQSAR